MRILFCNIAWMDYYKGIVPGKDEPKNGGSYVKDTKDAHEKYNFKPELLKLKGFPEGEYCGDEKYQRREKEPAKY